MRKKKLHRSFTIILVFFINGMTTNAQVQWDTLSTTYLWTFEPTFKQPTQKEAYYCDQTIDQGYHQIVKEFLKKFRDQLEPGPGARDFEFLATTILRSDVVFISRKSKYVFEIQYGNYQNPGYWQSVGCYTHCMVDVSNGKILPEIWMSVTY